MSDSDLESLALEKAMARMDAASADLLSWTRPAVRPLFVPDENGEPDHIGSGVFLRFHNRCFVATAAHVLDAVPSDARLYARARSGGLYELTGSRFSSARRLNHRMFDKIDIGFIALESSCLPAFASCRFLTSDEMCVDDLSDYTPVVGSKYLALGFPHQLSPPKSGEARAVSWTGNPSRIEGSGLRGVIERSHALVEMNVQTIASELQLPADFDPTGMSGGGLFKFGSLVRGADGKNCLVGILIENHTSGIGSVLATRLSLVTEGIRAAFPELGDYIPQARQLRVNATLNEQSRTSGREAT